MGSFDEFAQPVIDDLNSRLTEAVTLLARERDTFGQRETELMKELAEAKAEIVKLKEDACAYHFCEIKALRFEIERLNNVCPACDLLSLCEFHKNERDDENAALREKLERDNDERNRISNLIYEKIAFKFTDSQGNFTELITWAQSVRLACGQSLSPAPSAKRKLEDLTPLDKIQGILKDKFEDSAKPAEGI